MGYAELRRAPRVWRAATRRDRWVRACRAAHAHARGRAREKSPRARARKWRLVVALTGADDLNRHSPPRDRAP